MISGTLIASSVGGCGGGGESAVGPKKDTTTTPIVFIVGTPNPVNVQVTTDAAHAASARLTGAGGGTITATGADGSRFTLVVPANTLPADTTVTLTPVTTVAGGPIGTGAVAVQFAPDGLQLLGPATLTIQPAHHIPAAQQVAFGYHGAGAELHLELPGTDTTIITIPIVHFSGDGVTAATAAQVGQLVNRTPTASSDQFSQQGAALMNQLHAGAIDFGQFQSQAASLAQSYFDKVVNPELVAGQSDDAAFRQAAIDAITLLRQLELLGIADKLQAMKDQINQLLQSGLQNAINREYAACASQHDYSKIAEVYLNTRQVQLMGLAAADGQIDVTKFLPCAIGSVLVTPASATIAVGGSKTFTATLATAAHEPLLNADSVPLLWNSSTESVATTAVVVGVVHQGVAIAMNAGKTNISASVQGPAYTTTAFGLGTVEEQKAALTVAPVCGVYASVSSWSGTVTTSYSFDAADANTHLTLSQSAQLTAGSMVNPPGDPGNPTQGATWVGTIGSGSFNINDKRVLTQPPDVLTIVGNGPVVASAAGIPSSLTLFVDVGSCAYELSGGWFGTVTVTQTGTTTSTPTLGAGAFAVIGGALPALVGGNPAALSGQLAVPVGPVMPPVYSPGGLGSFLNTIQGLAPNFGNATVTWTFTPHQ